MNESYLCYLRAQQFQIFSYYNETVLINVIDLVIQYTQNTPYKQSKSFEVAEEYFNFIHFKFYHFLWKCNICGVACLFIHYFENCLSFILSKFMANNMPM